MKKTSVFFILGLAFFGSHTSNAQSSRWLPLQLKNGNWSYQKPDGQLAFVEEFEEASPFTPSGIAAVVADHKKRFISTDGNFVKALDAYDSAQFTGRRDLFFIYKNAKVGLWSGNSKKELISPQFNQITALNTKRLEEFPLHVQRVKGETMLDFVGTLNQKSCLIQIQIFIDDSKKASVLLNQTKALYSSIEYYMPQSLTKFANRLFQVFYGSSQSLGLLDCNGKELVPATMKIKNFIPVDASMFTKQLRSNQTPLFIEIENEEGKLGLLELKKNSLIPCKYQVIRCLETQGPAIFYLETSKSSEVYFTNENNIMSVPSKEVDVNANYKLLTVMNSKKYYDLYSYSGQKLWSNWTFANGTWLANDLFTFLGDNGKMGLMEGYRTLLISPQYDEIKYLFSHQYFGVRKNSKWQVYDILKNEVTTLDFTQELKNGELRNPSKKLGSNYKLIHARQDDSLTLYLVERTGMSGYEGLVNDSGRWILKFPINEIIRVKNNTWLVLGQAVGKSALLERDSKGKYKWVPVALNGTFDKQIGENLLCIKSDPKTQWQYFDTKGLKALPFLNGSTPVSIEDNLITFKNYNSLGFYNPLNGVWIERGFYSKCEVFEGNEGQHYVLTLTNNQMGFADKKGVIMVLQQAPPFENRVAYVKTFYTDTENGFEAATHLFTEHLDVLNCFDDKGKLLFSNTNKTNVSEQFSQNGYLKKSWIDETTHAHKSAYLRLQK